MYLHFVCFASTVGFPTLWMNKTVYEEVWLKGTQISNFKNKDLFLGGATKTD